MVEKRGLKRKDWEKYVDLKDKWICTCVCVCVCVCGGIAPRILDFGTNGDEWSASRYRYPFDRWAGGPQSRSERWGEEKNSLLCPCRESNRGSPVRSLVTILTELPWLPIFGPNRDETGTWWFEQHQGGEGEDITLRAKHMSTVSRTVLQDDKEVDDEDGRWMELAQDRAQWQALELAVLNLLVLLPQC
jgi:hypothetical protein